MPPPWEEFTTKDPACMATRVKPPGTISVRYGELNTNGRKSMWRSATPDVVKVGATDKANVGCAMYSCGVAINFFLNS